MVSAAFKIENSDDIDINEIKLPLTGPNISFVGRISSKAEQIDDDCRFGVDLLEYNNFNFGNKEKMIFKLQVVFEAGPNSRFKKLATRLDIGKLIFISGFLDLDDNEIFVEAKEIDLLDDSISNQRNRINSKSPFSRTNKFKNNNIKKEKDSNDTINISDDEINEKTDDYVDITDNNIKKIEKPRNYGRKRKSPITLVQNQKKTKDSDDITDEDKEYEINSKKNSGKKKVELMDLSIQRLNNFINEKQNDEIDKDENQVNDSNTKRVNTKKNTNVTTRSQKSKDED